MRNLPPSVAALGWTRERYATHLRRVSNWASRHRAAINAAQQRRRRAKGPASRLGESLKKYGITFDRYLELFAAQSGVCAICQKVRGALCVDHDHVANQVRGLLCTACNRALGNLLDDPALCRRATLYLEAYRSQATLPRPLDVDSEVDSEGARKR